MLAPATHKRTRTHTRMHTHAYIHENSSSIDDEEWACMSSSIDDEEWEYLLVC